MRAGTVVLAAVALLGAVAVFAQQDRLIERAKRLELDTPYVPPPGDPLQHHTAGFAKIVCSAVFVSGLDADFAARNLGYFVSPLEARSRVGKPVVDRAANAVHIRLPDGSLRTALYVPDQGCVTLPLGERTLHFKPVRVDKRRVDSSRTWPEGDAVPDRPLPPEVDAAKLRQAVDAAFDPAAMTAALVVTWRGRLLAERYGAGVTPHTPLESWSMGKSLTAALLGVLIRQGVYRLQQPAPIPQWQGAADPRAQIRIADLLQMSSGLRIRAPLDPDYDPGGPYPEASMRSTTPRAGRCSGRPARSGAIGTPIRSWSTISSGSPSSSAARTICLSPSARCSTAWASAT